MSKIENSKTEASELSDEELNLVHGGSIGSFLTQLATDVKAMLSTGHSNGHNPRNVGMATSYS